MMKCLVFLLFVAASQAYVARVAREAQDIPAPRLTRITLIDDPDLAFVVDWTRVETPEDSDPVLGYKLKVWEQPKIKKYRYETINGVRTLVEEYGSDKFSDSDNVPTHKHRNILINGQDQTTAQVNDIEPGVTYESRVQAYTRNGDGPLSQPLRIQVAPKDSDRHRDLYNVE